MLAESHNRAYQEFLTLLEKFKDDCNNLSHEAQKTNIKQQFKQLQVSFQQGVAPLNNEELDKAIAARWQSVQTEIKREFRLLSTDVLFLNNSRQASTRDNRLRSLQGRITKLINYCQIMLNVREEESANDDENFVS